MSSVLQPNGMAQPSLKMSVVFGFIAFISIILSEWNILNPYLPSLKKMAYSESQLKSHLFIKDSLVIKLEKITLKLYMVC